MEGQTPRRSREVEIVCGNQYTSVRIHEKVTRALYAAKAGPRPQGGRLSDILLAVAADQTRERVSVADLFEVMSHRAFGALILIFAAPNVLPTPPGFSTLFAAPLIFLSNPTGTQLASTLASEGDRQTVDAACGLCRHRRQGIALARKDGEAAEAAPKLPHAAALRAGHRRRLPAARPDLVPANTAREHAACVRDMSFFLSNS